MAIEDLDIQQLAEAIIGKNKTASQAQKEISRAAKGNVKAFDDLNKQLRRAIEAGKKEEELSKKQLDLLDDINEARSEERKLLEKSRKTYEAVLGVIGKVGEGFFKLGDAQTKNADRIEYYTDTISGIPILGKGINELGKSLDFNVDIFKALSSTGADFGQSLIRLREGSRNALLPLLEFVDLIKDNSNNLALLFGTVNQGTARLSELTRSVRGELIPEFARFGVTTDEINEYLTTYLSLQRVTGRQEFLSTTETTNALRAYINELDKISKLTGIQRQELDKGIKLQQQDAVLNSYLVGLGPKRQAEVVGFIESLGGVSSEAGRAAANILATGFPFSELERNLVALVPGFMETITAFKEGRLSVNEAMVQMGEAANTTKRFGAQLALASQPVNSVITAMLPLRRNTTDLNNLTEQRLEAEDQSTAGLIELQEQLRRTKSQFEGLQTEFLNQLLPSLTGSVEKTTKMFGDMGNWLTTFSRENKEGFIAAYLTAQGLRYTANFAKEAGIVTAGVIAANKLTGPGAFLGPGGKGTRALGTMGRGLATAGRALPYAGAAIGVGTNAYELMDDNPDNNKRAMLGLIGATMGGLLGIIGGPMGVALGATIGSAAGNALGSMIEPRYAGGPVMTGSQYLVGEKGPELFTPKTAGTVTSNSDLVQMSKFQQMFGEQNAAFKQFAELSAKMEKHLNTLVSINARTETNTGNTVRRLANLGENLV